MAASSIVIKFSDPRLIREARFHEIAEKVDFSKEQHVAHTALKWIKAVFYCICHSPQLLVHYANRFSVQKEVQAAFHQLAMNNDQSRLKAVQTLSQRSQFHELFVEELWRNRYPKATLLSQMTSHNDATEVFNAMLQAPGFVSQIADNIKKGATPLTCAEDCNFNNDMQLTTDLQNKEVQIGYIREGRIPFLKELLKQLKGQERADVIKALFSPMVLLKIVELTDGYEFLNTLLQELQPEDISLIVENLARDNKLARLFLRSILFLENGCKVIEAILSKATEDDRAHLTLAIAKSFIFKAYSDNQYSGRGGYVGFSFGSTPSAPFLHLVERLSTVDASFRKELLDIIINTKEVLDTNFSTSDEYIAFLVKFLTQLEDADRQALSEFLADKLITFSGDLKYQWLKKAHGVVFLQTLLTNTKDSTKERLLKGIAVAFAVAYHSYSYSDEPFLTIKTIKEYFKNLMNEPLFCVPFVKELSSESNLYAFIYWSIERGDVQTLRTLLETLKGDQRKLFLAQLATVFLCYNNGALANISKERSVFEFSTYFSADPDFVEALKGMTFGRDEEKGVALFTLMLSSRSCAPIVKKLHSQLQEAEVEVFEKRMIKSIQDTKKISEEAAKTEAERLIQSYKINEDDSSDDE